MWTPDVSDAYAAVPEAVSSVVSVTTSGTRGSAKAKGEIRLSLVPAAERDHSNTQIAEELRRRLEGAIPGMQIRTRAPQGQFLLERILAAEEGVTVEVRGFDLDLLDALALQVAQAVAEVPGVTDVERSREAGIPQLEIRVDRDKVADLGLSVRDVTEVIETAVAGSKAGEYRVAGNSYRILVQLQDAEKRSLDEILDLTLRPPSGEPVVLRNLVQTRASLGPVTIERKEQQRLVTVSANVAGRDLGSVAAEVQTRLEGIAHPIGYDLVVAGNFEEQQKAFRELAVSLLLALLLVYMVLASQYESLRDPLLVMLTVPLAAAGVLLTLVLTDTTLNLQSGIGCLMLGGHRGQQRHSAGRPGGETAPRGTGHRRGPARGGPVATASRADDHGHHRPRPPAPGARDRRRGRCPGAAGARGGGWLERLGARHPGIDPRRLLAGPSRAAQLMAARFARRSHVSVRYPTSTGGAPKNKGPEPFNNNLDIIRRLW